MQQSPSWEAKNSLAIQEIPRSLWNPAFYRFHQVLAILSVLSQVDPV